MPWRVKTRNAMEEESKVALTRSRGNNRSEKYNFFQSQGFSFKKWEVRPFIFQGKSTEALRGHRCSRLIRVCFFRKSEFVFFFENRSLFFWKSEFVFWKSEFVFLIGAWLFRKSEVVFFENRSLFFENRSLFFWKSGFDFWKLEFVFFENRSLFWKKSEFVLFKIGVCFLKIRVLAPDSVLSFCSGVRTKSVADPGEGSGSPAPLYL